MDLVLISAYWLKFSDIMKTEGESKHFCLVPDITVKAILLFSNDSYLIEEVPFIPSLLSVTRNVCCILSNALSICT